jgi:outer membrane cobalamin receptor
MTGANGRFRIVQLAPGNYVVAVHRLGYAPVSAAVDIAADDTLRPSFAMAPIANALDTMVVFGKSLSPKFAEFEERRRLGFGHFLTQADIEKRIAVSLVDLLRGIPSVAIGGDVALNLRDAPLRTCPFVVYLDGVVLGNKSLSLLPRPSAIAGIEIYSGPSTIPLLYKSANTTCGVILIWTKDGST